MRITLAMLGRRLRGAAQALPELHERRAGRALVARMRTAGPDAESDAR